MALDSVGYYALPIIPSFKGIQRGITTKIKTTFGKTGTEAGKLMGDNVAKGLASARGKVDSAAAKHAKSLDKVKTASGQARVEIQKLNEAISKGVGGSRLTAQTERTAAALRREAAAAREAKTAETQLANARRTLSSTSAAGGGLSQATQNIEVGGSTAVPVMGKLGGKAGGAFMAGLAAVVSVAAVGSLLKSAFDVGVDFERAVNAFSGVTAQAGDTAEMTAVRMDKMRVAARALGADTQLAGVSARDAGNAMLELAKGGLTADQAMEAARGTLQLATAGQLDAAEAAKIQSGALNTFGLGADQAMRVADLLAASANASSADVSDLGLALQQSGAVAAGFGVSIEDTLTALTMMSRAGVNGSDAGTLLKTSMQAITDQGEPAQAAIKDLGLVLYDQQDRFVGLESMMKQVAEASTRMSEEQFQAATNVLFGSDAMRGSMIAAQGGAAAWDSAAQAATRQGAAADMAAAQTQGLPGIVEALGNAWEGFKLKLFDVIDGPLISIGNWFVEALSGNGPQWLKDLGTQFQQIGAVVGTHLMPALRELWDSIKGPLLDAGKQWIASLREAWPIIKVVGAVIGGVLLAGIKQLSVTLPIVIRGLQGVQFVAEVVFGALKTGAEFVAGAAQTLGDVFSAAWEIIKAAFTAGWSAIEPVFEKIKGAFQGVKDFVSGVWSGLAGVVKGAFDGIINAVKGPLRTIGGLLSRIPTSLGPIDIPGAQAARDLGATLQGLRAGTDKRGVLFGPGTGTSDSILGIDAKTGLPTAFVSAGEGIVKASAMRAGGAAVVAMLNGYKGGGTISSEEQARMGGATVNASILEALRAVVPGAQLISAKTDHDNDGGFHPRGQAIDVDPSRQNLDALWAMRDKLTQIIFDDPNKVWYNVGGQRAEGAAARAIYGEATMAQHGSHIHVAAASPVSARGGRRGNLPSLAALGDDAGPEEIARHIAAEGIRRGYNEQEIVAAIAAGLKESGLDAQVTNATGHKGIFQMDYAKPGRDTAKGQIEWFYGMLDKLGGPGGLGDPFATIADKVEVGGYSGATLSSEQGAAAQHLYDKVAGDLTVESPEVNIDASGDTTTTGATTEDTGGEGPQISEVGSIFKQFLSDTFGFGDLLPDPAELGIVKLASAIMGIKYTPQGKGFPWQVGYPGGTGEPWSGNPFAPTGAEGLGGAAGDILGGLIPGVNIPPPPDGQPHGSAGHPVAPGPLDQSTHVTINSPNGDPKDVENRTRWALQTTPRQATYNAPQHVGGPG